MAKRFFHGLTLMLTIAMLALMSTAVLAQDGGDGDGGGGDGDGGNVDDGVGGVIIDAQGVLKSMSLFDDTRALDRAKAKAAKTQLDPQLQKATDLRFISLRRLEEGVRSRVENGKPVPADMKYLAGMTRLTHVFLFPDSKDIVIGGPAEGFYKNAKNQVVGIESGKPVLHLTDLVTALRSFSPKGNRANVISCSIDPTKEGIVRLNQAVSQVQAQPRAFSDEQVVGIFRDALGPQTITVKGISPKTRMAHTLVNADYHMKLIGIGLERPPVRITTFIEKTKPISGNALIRWYFQPGYDCVKVNEDNSAMQLVGGGVELVAANERVNAQGDRKEVGKGNRASRIFCNSFTKMYDKLAEKAPLFSELRNVMDLTIAAAFIQQNQFYSQADWDMDFFGNEQQFSVETLSAPKFVDPVINYVRQGGQLTTPIGGGVNIQPRVAVSSSRVQKDTDGELQQAKSAISMSHLGDSQWWWD